MMTEEILVQVSKQHTDQIWLNDNADAIYDAIATSIQRKQNLKEAIDTLLTIFPQILLREDLRRWGKLISDAHKAVQGQAADGDVTDSGQAVFVLNRREIKPLPTKKRRRRQQRVHPQEMLEIYITLLMWQAYYDLSTLTEKRINGALSFARQVNDPHLYHKLYQALMYLYNRLGEHDRALDYGRLAFSYWKRQENTLETALTAYGIALAHHGLVELDDALKWVELASDLFARIDYPRQHAIVAMETASIYIWMKEYDAAIQWGELAQRELEAQSMRYHSALNLHYLAAAQAYAGQYDVALNNVQQSIDMWYEMDNTYQREHAYHTQAYIQALMGDTNAALSRLDECQEMLSQMPPSGWRELREGKVARLRRAIQDGEDLHELSAEN